MKNSFIQHIKELNRNYLVLQGDENGTEPDFQMRMAAEADIPVFLKLQIRQIDCRLTYYYDSSGKVSLEEWLEHRLMQRKELEALFHGLFQAYEAAEVYLLDGDRILLSPSCIMVNGEGIAPQFCYGTEGGKSFLEGIEELMQYLLTRLDHSDAETVRAGYTLYQYSRKAQCTIKEMIQVFECGRSNGIWVEGETNLTEEGEREGLSADTVWDSGLPAVVSGEKGSLLSAEPVSGLQIDDKMMEYKKHSTQVSGLQWLLLSVLSGALALIGGIYCLIGFENSGQGGWGLLMFGIVLLMGICIWGMYWFYRENSLLNMKKQ